MKTTVAALQIEARLADVEYNLAHVEELALAAIADGAKIISVPEFFTTTIVLDDRIWGCALPPDNKAVDLFSRLALENQIMIGGSYLEKRDGDIYNCYILVGSDGKISRHDKDRPTMIENAFYVGGQTNGVHETGQGRVGTAVCWELIRTQTVNRLQGEIDFAMTGTHWWTVAQNWSIFENSFKKLHKENLELFKNVPSTFAGMLGVANIHASHCGGVLGKYPLLPKRLLDANYETSLLGETQIVSATGEVLKRMSMEDGAGFISADIDLVAQEPTLDVPERYWIPKLPLSSKLTWWHQNFVSKGVYKNAKKKGLF